MLREISAPEFTTGAAWMDELHHGTAICLRRTCEALDRDFTDAYAKLVARLELAFREEEERMSDLNPATIKCHREQHARVLRGMHCAYAQILDGDVQLGRQVANELLPRWLSWHIAEMDIPLANSTTKCANDNTNATNAFIDVS